jgi:L-seryl-tRNA(Ser) seleniumtransferase
LALVRGESVIPGFEVILARVRNRVKAELLRRIQPVINGTGVLLHTNLGRAPMGLAVADAVVQVATQYSNLEYDLLLGERGGRASYLESSLAQLCEAEAATIVNNCAAALVLILRHFTRGEKKDVLISRGELVQIGGGFRIPDILEASGARLREVGTTNRTSLEDYRRAIDSDTAMILKVHQSNFFMEGFVGAPDTSELAALARLHGIPFVEDLGSGSMVAVESVPPAERDPTAAQVLRQGVDLVCFSGDKLLGGPQAGIIAGRHSLVSELKQEPFFRALRCDKLILTALQATVEAYLEAGSEHARLTATIPLMEMMSVPLEALKERARAIVHALADLPAQAELGEAQSQIGGGTLPKTRIESVTIDLVSVQGGVEAFAERLRCGDPAVIGYVSSGKFRLDLRTIQPRQDARLIEAIQKAAIPKPGGDAI